MRRRVVDEIKAGLSWGVFLAVGYGVLALAIFLISGGTAFEQVGVPLYKVLLGYAVGGALSGIAFGLFRPLGASWWGAALLGFLVAVPSSFVVMSLVVPRAEWHTLPELSLAFAALAGPVTGLLLWWDTG